VQGQKMEYNGPREANGIVAYVKKNAGPPVAEMALADLSGHASGSTNMMWVHFHDGNQGEQAAAFLESAKAADRETTEFISIKVDDFSSKEFEVVTGPSIAAITPGIYASKYEPAVRTSNASTKADIDAFVAETSMPIVGELNADTYKGYFFAEMPSVRVVSQDIEFAKDAAKANAVADVLRQVAVKDKYKGKFTFSVEYPIEFVVDDFGVKDTLDKSVPLVVIDNRYYGDKNAQKKYLNMPQPAYTIEEIEKFLDAYTAGTLKSAIKSEAVPEPAKMGEVATIVGNNFEDIVMDESKDVFLEIYAPWCGHCKKLAPTWDSLAKDMQDSKNVVIAKLDGTANDIPHPSIDVKGFPTILFLKGGSKASPITYDGARDLDGFKSFLKKNSDKVEKDDHGIGSLGEL